MIYKSNNKYYVKISGYLIEVIPFLNNGELDFKTTENKIEITADVAYRAVDKNIIKNELIELNSKPKKVTDTTHKYKF